LWLRLVSSSRVHMPVTPGMSSDACRISSQTIQVKCCS
jgi:hypothetical protein